MAERGRPILSRRAPLASLEVLLRPRGRARRIPAWGVLLTGAGFVLLSLAGTGLLMLPAANAGDSDVSFGDALFTAVSALCVAGITVVDTQSQWTFLGEAIILGLVQLGAFSFTLLASAMLWVRGRHLELRDPGMFRSFYGSARPGEIIALAARVGSVFIVVQLVGMVALWFAFVAAGVPASTSVWWSVFHSGNAFANASFELTGAGFIPFGHEVPVLLVVAALAVIGSLGPLPVLLVLERRRWRRFPLDVRLILVATAGLLALGTVVYLLAEWNGETGVGSVDAGYRPVVALFEAAMRTTGYSAVPIESRDDSGVFFASALSFIGGAAGSATGGIKVGTFAILVVAVISALRGHERVILSRREVPYATIGMALTVTLLMIAVAFAAVVFLVTTTEAPIIAVLDDALGALALAGRPGEDNRALTLSARYEVLTMIVVGRFLPLLLVYMMSGRRRGSTYRRTEDSIRIG